MTQTLAASPIPSLSHRTRTKTTFPSSASRTELGGWERCEEEADLGFVFAGSVCGSSAMKQVGSSQIGSHQHLKDQHDNRTLLYANALRGPSLFPGILKPDVMAPGFQVMSAWPSHTKIFKACPHASGVAALLKGVHPEWSPSAIKSAIMTTADPYDSTHSPIKDSSNNLVASPLAMGAGQIQPNQALDPGLIYDASPQDYTDFLCSMNFTKEQIWSIIGSKKHSCLKRNPDFNYPAFVVSKGDNGTSDVQNFRRTVTNAGEGAAT
ncbi:Subtilisin-like protease SDD1 [Morella rubra]|uniref:Subtilisin-like protease SDD1 n=1 Tax=Morella rubra TaxID=262757 RepID=A0A6A1VST5_9ROSI|nr:Subtilisin-like protease SDD1 [Morella rubra]